MSDPNKSLAIFEFQEARVRSSIDENGEPWFAASDVCAVLGIANVGNALARLDEDERDDIRIADVTGRMQLTAFINESGLYSLILTSRKPEAKAFKKWITSEVLPALRKTGSYTQPDNRSHLEKAGDALRALKAIVQNMEEQQAQLASHEERIEAIEDRQTGIEHGTEFFTVLGYVIHNKLPPIDQPTASAIGRAATKLSNVLGYRVGRVRDPRFGDVNTYHETILAGVFADREAKKGKRT